VKINLSRDEIIHAIKFEVYRRLGVRLDSDSVTFEFQFDGEPFDIDGVEITL
jgi:hypothetical protein